jgi:hypothetical protein
LIFTQQVFNGCVYNESAVLKKKPNQKYTEEFTTETPSSSGIQGNFSKVIIFKTKERIEVKHSAMKIVQFKEL